MNRVIIENILLQANEPNIVKRIQKTFPLFSVTLNDDQVRINYDKRKPYLEVVKTIENTDIEYIVNFHLAQMIQSIIEAQANERAIYLINTKKEHNGE